MKTNRKRIVTNRQLIDSKLTPFLGLREIPMPKEGWLKTVRSALGLSTEQLGSKMGIEASGVFRLEKREALQTATLGMLDRAARAVHCRLVWAIVPEEGNRSLSDIVEKRAALVAARMVRGVDHSMKLEDQSVSPEALQHQIEDLAGELTRKGDRRIWEDEETGSR